MSETIRRDVGDKLKGLRLQKLRAVSLMLDAVQASDKPFIYGAVEHYDDVYVNKPGTSELFEENKNYAPGVAFTLNSHEVINTLVIFLDIWIDRSLSSKNVFFGYYSTTSTGKESTTELIKKIGVTLPDKPVLDLLQTKELDYKNLLPCIKQLIIAEYERQYTSKGRKGNIEQIKQFTDENWKKFLSCIEWKFGQVDEIVMKAELIQKVKKCKYFNQSADGKEESILAGLLELFDERQRHTTDVTEKFVHGADIQVKFMEICSGALNKPADPVWQMWEKIEHPVDKRNLIDKIKAVCNSYSQDKMTNLSRKVSRSLIEKQSFETDRDYLSVRYRIFEQCEKKVLEFMREQGLDRGATIDEKQIDGVLETLVDIAKKEIDNMSQTFVYRFMSNSIIEGMILELFESCYLAFNQKQ